MAIKIYIDQGHNPVNPNAGSEGNGLREQDIVYRIGQLLAERLRADGRFAVRLSRPTASTQLGTSNATSLAARVNDANSWGADYFVSLHTNASDNSAVSGTETLAYSRDTRGYGLAQAIQKNVVAVTGLPDRGVKLRPGLYVLRKTRMPAVLAELGFITNPGDAALLSGSPGLFADGLFRGITSYTLCLHYITQAGGCQQPPADFSRVTHTRLRRGIHFREPPIVRGTSAGKERFL